MADKKFKWGIIGCGGIADRRTIPGMMLSETSAPYAVMDANLAVAEKVREKYGAKYAFDKFEDILALSEIDAVYIASPVFCHKEQALAAARAGKHTLIEKPVGFTADETLEIIEEFEKTGTKLGIGFMMRYHAYHQAMKKAIADGLIGEVVSAHAQFVTWYPDMKVWRQEKRLSGGGSLMDMGVHCIDLISYITGLDIVECTGFAHNQCFSYDVDDSAMVALKLSNGALANVHSAFNLPDGASDFPLEFYGTRGSIRATGTISQVEEGRVILRTLKDDGSFDESELKVEFGNMYTKEIDAFTNAIETDTEPPVNGRNTLAVQKVVDAIYAHGGGKIS